MHSRTILFCSFLWTTSQPSLSLIFPQAYNFPFDLPNTDEVEEYQHQGYIVGQNVSSITIVIKLDKSANNALVGTKVHYRVVTAYSSPSYEWSDDEQCYVTQQARQLHDNGTVGHDKYRGSEFPSLQETIVVGNLQFPGAIYELDIISYRKDGTWRRALVEASTQSVLPANSPKIEVGSFRVLYNSSTDRRVGIYWQHVNDSIMEYEVFAFESDNLLRPVFIGVSPPEKASLVIDISLKRHTFFLRYLNEIGRSRTPSIVEVPAQEDILPSLRTYISNGQNGTNKKFMNWRTPENITITNYTLCWYNTREDGKGVFVQQFKYHENDVIGIDIKADSWVNLAMSVNTGKGSSGLMPVFYNNKIWPFEWV